MAYSNRELGDLSSMNRETNQGRLIAWLNKSAYNDAINFPKAQKVAGDITISTLRSYLEQILKSNELQEKFQLSEYGLEQGTVLLKAIKKAQQLRRK